VPGLINNTLPNYIGEVKTKIEFFEFLIKHLQKRFATIVPGADSQLDPKPSVLEQTTNCGVPAFSAAALCRHYASDKKKPY